MPTFLAFGKAVIAPLDGSTAVRESNLPATGMLVSAIVPTYNATEQNCILRDGTPFFPIRIAFLDVGEGRCKLW